MARQTYGITTSSITWEKPRSEISVNETGLAEISVEGAVNSNGIGLEEALNLIPDALPTGSSGPIGASAKYAGAKLATKSARYEEGTWQVAAKYQKSGSLTSQFPDGTDQSGDDRYERRIVVQEAPILSHPVALAFETKQKNMLANLLNGNSIIPNPNYDPEGESSEEFGYVDVETGGIGEPAEFDETPVTVGGITGSPLQYARLIKAGIITYQRKSIRHSWVTTRNEPASNDQYRKVGAVVSSPPKAPSLKDGFQWMLTGIIDSSDNGETWSTSYEFEASGAGGYLAMVYEGGNEVLDS
jgi:hypothetical protein